MTIIFKSPLVLACLVSLVVSKAFKIDKFETLDHIYDRTKKKISLDVSFYKITSDVVRESYSTKTGSKCLSLDEGFNLFIEAPKDSYLNENFYFALNSGSYHPIPDIEYITEDTSLEFVCFLWGSWWPKNTSKDSKVEFYFNAITKPKVFEKYNILLFNLDANGEKLKLDLSIGQNSLSKSELTVLCDIFTVGNTEYTVISSNRENYVLKGVKYTYKGDGNLNMFSILDKSDDAEVEAIKNTKDKKIISSFWKRMICSTERFEFLDEAAKTNGSEISGVNILI